MSFVLLLPVVASVLMLSAHFLRSSHYALAIIPLAVFPLLFVRERWVARVTQGLLAIGTVVWIITMVSLVGDRTMRGQPFGRGAAIIGGVALFTAASALVFQTRRLRARYAGAQTGGVTETAME
jgi:hypothetical protein